MNTRGINTTDNILSEATGERKGIFLKKMLKKKLERVGKKVTKSEDWQ